MKQFDKLDKQHKHLAGPNSPFGPILLFIQNAGEWQIVKSVLWISEDIDWT